jgi:hypothetical protein
VIIGLVPTIGIKSLVIITKGNARFANSAKLLAKTPTLLAKAFPTGFPSSCWERIVAVLSDGKELFANRNAGPAGKALPKAMCTVGEGGTPSAQLPLPSPTRKRRLLAKTGWQRERQLCQQFALPTAWLPCVEFIQLRLLTEPSLNEMHPAQTDFVSRN